jgi:hypothetical protein
LESPNEKTSETVTQPDQTLQSQVEHAIDSEKRKMHVLNMLEAALYVAGRPLDINEICQVVSSRSKKRVIGYLETLMQQYKARSSPMEILPLKDERYVLQSKLNLLPLSKNWSIVHSSHQDH